MEELPEEPDDDDGDNPFTEGPPLTKSGVPVGEGPPPVVPPAAEPGPDINPELPEVLPGAERDVPSDPEGADESELA